MLKKYHQEDYIGEYIITNTKFSNGKKHESREWVDVSVTNELHNKVAHVIGNGESRSNFKLKFLAEVHGGLLAKKMGQTYGCNAVYRDFSPDFLILNNAVLAQEFADQFPNNTTTAFTYTKNILQNIGKYHLIPYNIKLCAGATAAYLACFHGHKTIYLLGFDNQKDAGTNNNIYAGTTAYSSKQSNVSDSVFIQDLNQVMSTYDDVEFVRIVKFENTIVPDMWKWRDNFRQIDYRHYISECDIGVSLNYLK